MTSPTTQRKTRTAFAATVVAMLIAAAQPVLACAPEIVVDPTTGAAMPQSDLEQALAEILHDIQVADAR